VGRRRLVVILLWDQWGEFVRELTWTCFVLGVWRYFVAVYITVHFESSRSFLTDRATREASVKASLTPLLRIAEHSRYRMA